MIRSNASIEVVLIKRDDPDCNNIGQRYNTAGYRFKNFFSGRKINILYCGVEEYINNLS